MKQTEHTYDVVVIGAGSAGLTAAISLSGAGKSVLLVERDLPGGECTHNGCVPSKALLYHAKQQKVKGSQDSQAALAYARERIAYVYAEETPDKLAEHGLTTIKGTASFRDRCSVEVAGTVYTYKKCILATGSSPRLLEVPGLEEKDILTNQNFFEQTSLPPRLLVIGSGPVGMELSQAAALVGSQVTMVSKAERFAHVEDPAISARAAQAFESLGIEVYLQARVHKVAGSQATLVYQDAEGQEKEKKVTFDKVLVAIGRVPNLPGGLKEAGINFDRHGIDVDGTYRTSNRHVYAIGDVSQRLKFTHTANDTARGVVKHILTRGLLGYKESAVPKVTYTAPEIASVGLSWEEAVKKYGEESLLRLETPYTTNDRAKTDQAEEGLVVVIARRLSGKVLGANIIGQSAGEILSNYTLAINQGVSLWKLSSTIYPYPTISQIVKKSGDQFALATMSKLGEELRGLLKRHATKIFALLFWAVLLWWIFTLKASYGMSNREVAGMLFGFLSNNLWGPLLYMLVYVLRPLIFFPATVLTALSGALFGLPLGILFTVIGENGSANLAYWVGRFFGNDAHLEDNRLFGRFVKKAQDEPFIAVLLMRFLYVPFDLTNYGSGIMKIRWRAYALATVIGILPGLITFVALGASLDLEVLLGAEKVSDLAGSINPWMLVFTVVLFLGSLLLARFFKKKYA